MLRLLVLLIYVGLLFFLQQYLRKNPVPLSSNYVERETRPALAIFWMFGPSLLPLLGLLWSGVAVGAPGTLLGIIPFTPFLLLMLAFCVPILIYSLLFIWVGIFRWSGPEPMDRFIPHIYAVGSGMMILLCSIPLLGAQGGFVVVFLCLISLAIPPLLTILFLRLWGPEMLPLDDEQKKDTRAVMAYIIGHFCTFPKPSIAIVKDAPEIRIAGNPFHGSGPGLVLTEAHNAVVIKDSTSIKNITGPGTIFTQDNEQIHSVVDLRQQIRVQRVQAQTRDGIKVDMPVASIFRINAGGRKPVLGQPWPFNKRDAYKAIFAAEVNPEGKTPLDAHEPRPWEKLSVQVAEHALKQEVSRYSLNELYALTDAEGQRVLPRGKIGGAVKTHVVKTIEPKGIKIEGGGVGNKIIPIDKRVVKQRIESWKAAWIRKVMDNVGQAGLNRMQQQSRVRSEVRGELLHNLVEQSQALQKAGPETANFILTLQLLETLEHIAQDPKVEPLLPESAESTLRGLRMHLETRQEDK